MLDIPITTSRLKYDGVGNVIEATDANSHTTKYEYDPVNRQIKTIDALGRTTSEKTYDKVGRVLTSKNLYGEITTSIYDDASHIMTMNTTNLIGNSKQQTDAFGNVVSTTDPVGRTNTYEYDKLNRRTKSTDYRGRVITDTYDDFNNLIQEYDTGTLNTIDYRYDELNRRVNTKDTIGQISYITYDNVGNKVSEQLTVNDGAIRATTYKYDELNRQISMTRTVDGATTAMSYDGVGNVVSVKDPLGRITATTYDKLNRQTAVTRAFGTADATTSTYKYDNVGNLRFETNGVNSDHNLSFGTDYKTEYKYDALNRRTDIIDPDLDSTQIKYTDTATGRTVETTDALHHTTKIVYDSFGREVGTYDGTGHRTSASQYDAVDRVVVATDTFGKDTTYKYTEAPGTTTTEIVDPIGGMAHPTIEKTDKVGNLIYQQDSLGHITRHKYDERNRQTKITDAEGGVTNYTYDADGKTKTVEDAVHNVTTYTYDLTGRLITESTNLGDRTYKYDLVGNRTQMTDRIVTSDGSHRTTNYGYDNLNRVTAETWVGGNKSFTYTYDKNGNRLTADDGKIRYDYRYDQTDLREQVDRVQTGKPKVSFKYTYDDVGNLTQADELIGTSIIPVATTIYKYDDSRSLNTEMIQSGTGLVGKDVKFIYDATGLNTNVERYVDGLLKVKTSNAFDDFGRLTGIKQERKNTDGTFTVIGNSSYELDIQDRLQTQTVDGQSRNIEYDNVDQVRSVSGSSSEAYSYDKNGNRINAGHVTDSYNRLISDGVYNYDYDPEGNRKSRTNIATNVVDNYVWDYRNRLSSIVTIASGGVVKTVGYEYDVDDQRVRKTVASASLSAGDGVVENYVIDRDQIAFVTDGGGSRTEHYLYGLNVDSVMAQDSPAGMVWSLADRLGSVDTLTDADGVVVDKRTFDSFGRVLSETNPLVSFRYGYTGRELDLESGLNYYRARYYDSNVGRFISVDPMGFGAGDTNLYRYVGNNSTNATDPTGMWVNFAVGAAIGGGLDLGIQLSQNGGDLSKVNWASVGVSTVTGAIGGGIGGLLSKQGVGLAARTTITAGAEFNLGYWGKVTENKLTGKDDLFEGALLSGSIGGVSGAGGELLQAGAGAAWGKYGSSITAGARSLDQWGGSAIQQVGRSIDNGLNLFSGSQLRPVFAAAGNGLDSSLAKPLSQQAGDGFQHYLSSTKRGADGRFVWNGGSKKKNTLGFSSTTDRMRKDVESAKYIDPLTNKEVTPVAGTVMAPDHIYPTSLIENLKGFNELTTEQKKAIIRDTVDVGNIQPLPKSLNESKGNKLNWNTYGSGKSQQKLDQTYVKELQRKQREMKQAIQMEIDNFTQLNKSI